MAVLKCKMCGGDIVVNEEKTYGMCDYCGSTMTLPKVSDDQRAARFNRGNHFRRQGDFDKALAVYETIVNDDETDAEAHWCCALCRFGIEYVEDPNTYEYLPTCHRASFDSFLEDADYLAALEYSDGITRRQYQKDAAKIASVQRGILATSQNEEPYDVFICYKETDDSTKERTRDSLDAQDIYYQLTQEGFRVFFSRITLEDKAGAEYEPYIFAALNSAKVMIAIGSKSEYFNAVWVKNEWSRFLAMMRKDRSKLLLPCYKDMDPYDLPEQLGVLQSYDMSKIGFVQDLIRGVKKVIAKDDPKAQIQQIVTVNAGLTDIAPLIKRMFMYLEDGEWDKANEYAERVLDKDPESAEAYLGKLMVDLKVLRREDLKDQSLPFNDNKNYQKALRFADEKIKNELNDDIEFIKDRIDKEKRRQEDEQQRIKDKEERRREEEKRRREEEERRREEEKRKKEEQEREKKDWLEKHYHLCVQWIESEKRTNQLHIKLPLLQKQIKEYTRISELEKELSGLGLFALSRKKEIKTELDIANNRIAANQKKLDSLTDNLKVTSIDALKAEIAKTEKELEQSKAELEDAENKLWRGKTPRIENTMYGKKQGNILYPNNSFLKDGVLKTRIPDEYVGIVIPDSTMAIGKEQFSDCQTIIWAIIPDGVTSIGAGAFECCSNLTYVAIPDSVTSIGMDAFLQCSNLTNVAIPDSVTSIEAEAFCSCSNLTSITIPNNVTSIDEYAFAYCGKLDSICVDLTNKKYDSRDSCNAIIETETNILLAGCSATIIPDSVTGIAESAFSENINLTAITIPYSVTSIGDCAFKFCERLNSICVDSENKKYDSRDNCNAIIETETNTLLVGCSATVIPDSVTGIAESAFSGNKNLTAITIPYSVTSIGDCAFKFCERLNSICVDSENKKYDSRDNCNAIIEIETNTLLVGCSATIIPDLVTGIAKSAFLGCTNLTSIEIPGSVTDIGEYAFSYCEKLTNVVISNGVKTIGSSAFKDCTNLKNIEIPGSVTSIGFNAFKGCTNLSEEARATIEKINPKALSW